MKERPIIMTGHSVRAILDGRKTQTRRLVKGGARQFGDMGASGPSDAYDVLNSDSPPGSAAFLVAGDHGYTNWIDCPHGAPGDRLWVKETWQAVSACPMTCAVAYAGDACAEHRRVLYRADGDGQLADYVRAETPRHDERPAVWRPSLFLRRPDSRLALEVAAVRCERLQDITEADIIAEGCTVDAVAKMTGIPWSSLPTLHIAWREAWDAINGKRAPWSSNPWVWALTFRRVAS